MCLSNITWEIVPEDECVYYNKVYYTLTIHASIILMAAR